MRVFEEEKYDALPFILVLGAIGVMVFYYLATFAIQAHHNSKEYKKSVVASKVEVNVSLLPRQ